MNMGLWNLNVDDLLEVQRPEEQHQVDYDPILEQITMNLMTSGDD